MIPMTPDNVNIWLYHFVADFPFACLHEKEEMFDEYLFENYPVPGADWCNEFTGGVDENRREPDPWEGYSLDIGINERVSLGMEFRPFGTRFFLNDTYVGESGGHSKLSLISWQELLTIAGDNDLVFMMMLSLTTGNESEREEIRTELRKRLSNELFQFRTEDIPVVAEFLTEHLIHEEDVHYTNDPTLGILSDRNHSFRNPLQNSPEEIIEINQLIEMAKGK